MFSLKCSLAVYGSASKIQSSTQVFLEVGEAARVVLLLDDRSISVYDVASHAWRVVMVKNDTPLPCFTQTLRARL
jgi:hypothetical protein